MTLFLMIFFSALLIISWIPLLYKFYTNWESRKNPVSLAICALIVYVMYLVFGHCWLWFHKDQLESFVLVTDFLGLAVMLNFYIARSWAKRHFPESRTIPPVIGTYKKEGMPVAEPTKPPPFKGTPGKGP